MRLRGDYLAIVTLAFGEIIKNLLNNFYIGVDDAGLHFSMTDSSSLGMTQGAILINGPKGAVGIDKISTFALGILLVLITVAVVLNLMHSRDGRAIMAVRDNRIAAESVGINVTKYRLMAFTVASALAGAAGVLYAMNYSTITPVAVRLQPVDPHPGVRGSGRHGQHLRLTRDLVSSRCCPRSCAPSTTTACSSTRSCSSS